MRCRSVRKRLVALHDGEVTPSERVQLEEHLATCAECRSEHSRLGALPPPQLQIPADVGRRLWEKVRATPVLARVRQHVPSRGTPRPDWMSWLQGEAGVSRAAVLAYGALLSVVLVWGMASWWPQEAPEGERVAMGEDAGAHDTVPARHTGLPAREIQPQEWQNASFPSAGP